MIGRYEHPAMTALWSPEAIIDRWVQIELAALRARGVDDLATEFMGACRPTPGLVRLREQVTRHEFVAFLDVWRANLADRASTYHTRLHEGLTSSDVIDTAQALALTSAHRTVMELTYDLVDSIGPWAQRGIEQIGRTHGQYAETYLSGHPWDVFYGMLQRQRNRLSQANSGLLLAKLSGPVGWADDESAQVERRVLRDLGLRPCRSTQIVPRDGLVHWVGCLAELATICEAIATRVRLWSQSGVDEYHEGTAPGQVGSSAMAHKRHNPILSENICGLARMVRTQATTLQLGVVQWWDRDLAHSSVERAMLPDLCHLVCTILERTRTLVDDLELNEDHMAANVQRAQARKEATLNERMSE